MKTMQIALVLSFLLIGVNTQAQFLDKIVKKAENAAERTVLNRTDREVSKTTDKTIDGVIKDDGKKEKKKKERKSKKRNNEKASKKSNGYIIGGSGLEDLPDVYRFQYFMDMEVTSNKDRTKLRYYVEPDASYFGYGMEQKGSNSVVVYDLENRALITFMDNNGQKIAMKMRMPLEEEIQEMIKNSQDGEGNSGNPEDITPIAGKTILGYKCKGYLVKHDEGSSKIYITDETPVGFMGMLASMQKSKNMANIPFEKNTMMMEMEYTSNKHKKDNMHMICTKIEEKPFSVRKADYRGM